MNYSRKVLQLVMIFTAVLLFASLLSHSLGWNWLPLTRISLIEDITKKPPDKTDTLAKRREEQKIVVKENGRKLELALYHHGKAITDFNADTTQSSLTSLQTKLFALKKSGKGKIRIAYFGDSMIEGDLISGTFRELLQQYFGGSGVGFVSITSPAAVFRRTVSHNFSGWEEKNFKTETGSNTRVYISGHAFYTGDGSVTMTDKTITDSTAVVEKSLICGPGSASISVNGGSQNIQPRGLVNRIVIEKTAGHLIRLGVASPSLPVYGISFESEAGIFVDNFSFRGISGTEFARLDTALLKSVNDANAYDLIILQYGVNLMFRPDDKNYSWYGKVMRPSLRRIQHCFPQSGILLISAGDRAFRYGSEYKTAIGIDSLIKVQADIAYEAGCAFYNLYETMGGPGTIVAWANETPALANKDYVHPNFRGAEKLGRFLYDAMMNDYFKYTVSVK